MQSFTVTRLNEKGEGLTHDGDQELSVPFTLPGETVTGEKIERRKRPSWVKLDSVTTPSTLRKEPVCQHYGVCGGCSLQHVDDAFYSLFKTEQVARPLREQGIDTPVDAPIIIGPYQRRRIDFKAKKFPERLAMGFSQKNEFRRISQKECHLVDPDISALFQPLEDVLEKLLDLREEIHVFVLKAEDGIDLMLAGFRRELNDDEKSFLRTFAEQNNLLRLTYKVKRRAEVLYKLGDPYVNFDGHPIPVDPNVFLQASKKADQVLSGLVIDHLPEDTIRIADLFCGRGTLSIPMANKGYDVTGYEGCKHAITALSTVKLDNLTGNVRDLFESPLTSAELNNFDVIVMNPPRTGVKHHIENIIASNIKTVIYVSCGPETFATDTGALVKGGFNLTNVTPVDQFMWSHHVEVVGVAVR